MWVPPVCTYCSVRRVGAVKYLEYPGMIDLPPLSWMVFHSEGLLPARYSGGGKPCPPAVERAKESREKRWYSKGRVGEGC